MPAKRSISQKLCLLALLLTLPGASAWAALDSELQPLAKDSPLAGQLGAVGMVVSGEGPHGRSVATGFLVSACHVLTAAHVLANPEEHVKIGTALRFFPEGGSPLPFFERAVWGRVVAAGEHFVMHDGPGHFDLQNIAEDWALIELERPVPGVEPFKLLFPGATVDDERTFAIVGYPAQAAGPGLHAQEHCPNRSNVHGNHDLPGVLFVDCAVRQGMSGGPLLLEGGTTPVAAGIVVQRFEMGERILTVAVPSSAFGEQINAAMRESDICAAGQPFVWPPRRR